MRGVVAKLLSVAVLACGLGAVPAGPAVAGHVSKDCGIISKGSHDYRVHASHMKCKQARKSSVRYLRSGEPRAGFDCAPTAGNSFYCQDPPKAYWAIRL
jgi:hypothetical protein